MDRKTFEYKMRDYRFADFGRFMFFKKGMELYDSETDETRRFGSYKELYAHELPDGGTVGDLVDTFDDFIQPMAGDVHGQGF